MPRYTVILTRDVTQSAIVSVDAPSPEAAAEQALDHQPPGLSWRLDDNLPLPPYVTDTELEE